MSSFQYKAKNLQGKEEAGEIEAQDRRQLTSLLRQRGYFLLEVKTNEQKKARGGFRLPNFSVLSKFFSVPLTEKLFFTRNLAVMIRTGVSLVRAFEILSNQAKNKKLKDVLAQLAVKVNKGESLSGALVAFPKVFPCLFQETIKVGEETGKLESSLEILSKQMEREHELRSKIKSAMIYPAIVLLLALLIGVFMMIFAIPQLKKAFVEMEIQLPLTTRVILDLADMLNHHRFFSLLIILAAVFGLFFASRSSKGGKVKSALVLRIPLIAKIVKQTNSALTLRTMSSLLSAGVPVVNALEIASGALGNFYFKASLKEAARMVEKGEKVSAALKKYEKIYSPMVVQMMEIGEETGETANVLEKLAEFFEAEVSAGTERLSSVIEPLLILFLGAAVGFFAVAMIQPMFSAMQGIQ